MVFFGFSYLIWWNYANVFCFVLKVFVLETWFLMVSFGLFILLEYLEWYYKRCFVMYGFFGFSYYVWGNYVNVFYFVVKVFVLETWFLMVSFGLFIL